MIVRVSYHIGFLCAGVVFLDVHLPFWRLISASSGHTGRQWRRQVSDSRVSERLSPAARISLGYLVLGVIWILTSDRLAHLLFPQPHLNEIVQTCKGWAFVLVTSLFLFAICKKYLQTIQQQLWEMNQINQELKKTERHFRLLVEGATDHAIFMLGPAGEILSWNQGAQRVYGYTQEEILGKHISILDPDDPGRPPGTLETEMEVAREQGAFKSERWQLRKDGSRIWVDSVISPIKENNGQIEGYAKVTRDLTQLRLWEERVQSLNEDLERRVAERTTEIMVANQGLEMFSYSVSHDLRAPLRAISGFAEILSRRHRDNLNEQARHYLSNIIEAASQMNRLIDDLLALARVGRQAIRHEPVDPDRILESLLRETSPLAKDYGVKMNFQNELGTSILYSDPALLKQILLNLLTNAITYRRPDAEGGPQVWICLHPEGEDFLIEVTDNGIGIPEEYREKIFKPFQRLHSHDDYPGTGIGLAIVKKAVDLLSAKVWIVSTKGQGSSFCVHLPHCIQRSPS